MGDGETFALGVEGQPGHCARMIGRARLDMSARVEEPHLLAGSDRSRLPAAGDRQHVNLPSRHVHQVRDAAIW